MAHFSKSISKRKSSTKRVDCTKGGTVRVYRDRATGTEYSIARDGRDVVYGNQEFQSNRRKDAIHLETHQPDESCGVLVAGTFHLTLSYPSTHDNDKAIRNKLNYCERIGILDRYTVSERDEDNTKTIRLFPSQGTGGATILAELTFKDFHVAAIQSLQPSSTKSVYRLSTRKFNKDRMPNDRLASDANLADCHCPDDYKRQPGFDGRFQGKKPIKRKD